MSIFTLFLFNFHFSKWERSYTVRCVHKPLACGLRQIFSLYSKILYYNIYVYMRDCNARSRFVCTVYIYISKYGTFPQASRTIRWEESFSKENLQSRRRKLQSTKCLFTKEEKKLLNTLALATHRVKAENSNTSKKYSFKTTCCSHEMYVRGQYFGQPEVWADFEAFHHYRVKLNAWHGWFACAERATYAVTVRFVWFAASKKLVVH